MNGSMFELALPLVMALLPPAVVVTWLARTLVAHRILARGDFLGGTRAPEGGERQTNYSFALMNPEERALDGDLQLIVEPLLQPGRLRDFRLLGPRTNDVRISVSEDGVEFKPWDARSTTDAAWRACRVTLRRLRPLATVVIQCRADGTEGDLRLRLLRAKHTLALARGRHEPARRRAGAWGEMAWVTGLCLVMYVGLERLHGTFDLQADLPYLATIVGGTFCYWLLNPDRAAPEIPVGWVGDRE